MFLLDKEHKRGDFRCLLVSAFILPIIAIASGCTSLGPKMVRWERTEYNLAIQETEDVQLLLNLVRLKYRDTPIFLELSSISSQSSLETGIGTGELAEVTRPQVTWKLGPTLSFSTQPTITYTPFQGEKFAEQLLAPMEIETLVLLYRSGWPLKRVLKLGVQRLNRVENAVRASGPTPGRAPDYETFIRVVDLMAQLNHDRLLDIVYESATAENQAARITLQVEPLAFTMPETRELWKLLGLVPERKHYPVTYQVVEHDAEAGLDHLEVETRSLLGLMFFLSQAVEAPEEDVEAGRIKVTQTGEGAVFDWERVMGELFRIESSPSRPDSAAVSVEYRGHWFYIDDTDLSSKSTFSLLTQLVALQSGEIGRAHV